MRQTQEEHTWAPPGSGEQLRDQPHHRGIPFPGDPREEWSCPRVQRGRLPDI